MKNKLYITAGILVIIVLYFMFFSPSNTNNQQNITTKAIKGDLPIEIVTTGELKAKNSQNIMAPTILRSLGINQIKISSMVDEGTILKKGDYVASLDPSEIGSKLNQLQIDYDQKLSDLKSSSLDTSLTMRQERETIINLKYNLEENEMEVKQSKFEPPAVQRKAEINLEKAQRNYKQAKENLKLKHQQAVAKIFKVKTELKQLQIKIDKMQAGLQSMQVTAPQNGMIIYYTNWNGKVKPGSTINTWNPVIAKIPDLSEMVSITYVNEIDISKITKGQKTKISIDAFPDLKIKGEVVEIANIGQKLDGSDAKVFEVKTKVLSKDSTLRPSMTTTNKILIKKLTQVIYLPIDCVFSEKEVQFVYLKNGNSLLKKEIKTGESNNEYIQIIKGVTENQEVLLISPENEDKLKLVLLTK